MKYACITIIANKHLVKSKNTSDNIAVNGLYNTRLCGFNTVQCHTDHSPQCWSEVFFSFTQMFVIIVRFSYIYVSQGSVKTHLCCGGIYNNHIIASCPQSVPMKKFFKSVTNW